MNFPDKKYNVIHIDPPYPIQLISRKVRPNQKAMPYNVMTFEDIGNLPGQVIGAGKYGLDKLKGKGTKAGPFDYLETKQKFETPYELKFARNKLDKTIEEKSPEEIKRNLGRIEFDTTVLPNMTMKDDMEIPAFRSEIQKAKQNVNKAKGIDSLLQDDVEEKPLQPKGLYSILYGSNKV